MVTFPGKKQLSVVISLLVICRWSLVICHWSLVICHWLMGDGGWGMGDGGWGGLRRVYV